MQDSVAGNSRREAGRTRSGLTGRTLSPVNRRGFIFNLSHRERNNENYNLQSGNADSKR